jgi:hypothetical protein
MLDRLRLMAVPFPAAPPLRPIILMYSLTSAGISVVVVVVLMGQ